MITIEIKREKKIWLVPHLGLIREQIAPVSPTPQFKGSKSGRLLLMFQLTDSQLVTLTISAVDKKGNPVTFAGAPVWSVDNPNLLSLTPSTDGLSCVVASVGPLGTAKVSVSSTTPSLSGTLDVQIVSGAATQLTIVPGTPSEQP